MDFIPLERAVIHLSQNSAKAKKVGGRATARKSPIGSTNHQWWVKKTPTDESFTLYVHFIQTVLT